MTTTQTPNTATTILNQIPAGLRIALGLRDTMDLGNGVQFRITGTRTVWVTITHNAADLYNVKAFTLRSFNETIRFEATDLYTDQMIAILDQMDRGQIEL
jgi:hypothetical protein